MKKIKNTKGFTLMEMLIVVAIIAILIAIAIPTFTTQLEKAREAAVETMDEVRRAMKLNYFEDAALISSQSERFGTK